MNETKIQLSRAEMDLMCNAEIILTKNKILQKVKSLLELLQNEMMEFKKEKILLQNDVFTISPKISKGENYLGLPYLILDYPRNFSPENIFAIRTMFWWGHFFSTTLHLSGNYTHWLLPKAAETFDLLYNKHYFVGISNDPWQHHFEPANYQAMEQLSKEQFVTICQTSAHIKIAAKWHLTEWHFAATNLWESWKLLLSILH